MQLKQHRPQVAAMVDQVSADSVGVTLVNIDPVEGHDVVVQAGGFGEHAFTSITNGQKTKPVEGKFLTVNLGAGAQVKLSLGLKRFVNQPSYRFPSFG